MKIKPRRLTTYMVRPIVRKTQKVLGLMHLRLLGKRIRMVNPSPLFSFVGNERPTTGGNGLVGSVILYNSSALTFEPQTLILKTAVINK